MKVISEENINVWAPETVSVLTNAPLYRSKCGYITTTGSTIGLQGKNYGSAVNCGGYMKHDKSMHKFFAEMGRECDKSHEALHQKRRSQKVLSRKQIGMLEKPTNLKEKVKPALDQRKPVCGISCQKDWVVTNAIHNILMAPKKPASAEKPPLSYGEIPPYLQANKAAVAAEKKAIEEYLAAKAEAEALEKPLSEEDRETLVLALKAEWHRVNTGYQMGTHLVKLDSIGKIHRKETYEKQLIELEKAIERLSRPNMQVELHR